MRSSGSRAETSSSCRDRTSPTIFAVPAGSACAPPSGSGITSSMTPSSRRSWVVSLRARAASRAIPWSRQRIAAQLAQLLLESLDFALLVIVSDTGKVLDAPLDLDDLTLAAVVSRNHSTYLGR